MKVELYTIVGVYRMILGISYFFIHPRMFPHSPSLCCTIRGYLLKYINSYFIMKLKSSREIIKMFEEFSEVKKVDDENFVHFVEAIALSYKFFILNSFIIPLDKKSIYDEKMAITIYNYCLDLRKKLKSDRQGIELIQSFNDNIYCLCIALNSIVHPYDLKFRAIRFPQSITSQFI